MTVHYSEGSAWAVVRGGTVVVLPGTKPAGVVDELWTTLGQSGSGVAAVLGVLAAGGLAETPPFAVVSLSGGEPATSAHVAVRGAGVKVVVSAENGAGPVEVTGTEVVTWSERIVDGPISFAVTTDEAPADAEYPVLAAVLRASALRRTLVEGAEAPGLALPGVPAAQDPKETDAFPDFPTIGSIEIALPGGRAPSETIVPTAPDVPEVGRGAGAESTPLSPPMAPPPPPPGAVPALDTESPLGAAPVLDAAPSSEPASGPAAEIDESTQFGADDDYGHLFGDTVMRRVEDAAVRQGEDDEEAEDGPPPVPAPPPMPPPPPASDASSAPGPDPSQTSDPAGDALISGVPGGWSPAGTPAPGVTPGAAQRATSVGDNPAEAAPSVDLTDHDGETMMSTDIAELRKAAGIGVPKFSAAIVPGAQQILGLLCSDGHPNPPTSEQCRTCGLALEGDAELVPRPSLGRLHVTGGVQPGSQVVELDRPVIVGRRPRTNNASADRTPRLVTVASPEHDISRSHVEITLEEWHVLVADLATTNGTTLLRSGQAPRRLHPNEKVIVVDGDVVDLGDGASLAFEGIW